jgi:DNA-binding transcriptional ArsR family regulator
MTEQSPPPEPAETRLDGAQVRALAHPLRTRLLGALRIDGPATATTLAGKLGTNSGATSYHLRQLAEVGLVVEEADRGTGRQRWWRAAHRMHQYRISDFDDDPDSAAAANWLSREHLQLVVAEAQKWDDARTSFPKDWQEAADRSDYLLTIGPQRLRELVAELDGVILRYRDLPAEAGADARPVLLFLSTHPLVQEES